MFSLSLRPFIIRLAIAAVFVSSIVVTVGLRDVRAADCRALSGRRIDWIVPNKAGGGNDRYSRLLKPFLETALEAVIVVHNEPGAGGLVGSQQIVAARPDGMTLGFINAAGLIAAALASAPEAPHPASDFTLLARVAASRQVWATASDSPFATIKDVIREGQKRPIVCGTRDVGNQGFIDMALTSNLIGLDIDIVTGYLGNSAGVLAAMRGEVDIVAYNFDSILRHIQNGNVRPLLQVAETRIADHPALEGIPTLGGPNGLAAERARTLGRDESEAIADAAAISDLLAAGRLVVAPPGMNPELSNCLETALMGILNDPEFFAAARKAKLSLDIAAGADVRRRLQSAARKTQQFIPVIDRAVAAVRK